MSKQQLYINDVPVDMPAEQIKIKVASNILSDASKTMTAHSYSIVLPRTMTNDSLFALAYVVGSNTGGKSTHKYLKASLFVDGYPLFEGGQAVVNNVDDKGYNINLYWGLIDAFAKIKDEGLKLNQLSQSQYWDSNNEEWVTLQKTATQPWFTYDSGMSTSVYNDLDDDSKALANKYPWELPVETASHILDIIARTYSLDIHYSALATQRINKLCHALTTLKSLGADETMQVNIKGTMWQGTDNNWHLGILPSLLDPNTNKIIWSSSPLSNNNNYASNSLIANNFVIPIDQRANYFFTKRKLNIKKIRVVGESKLNPTFILLPYADGREEVDGTYNSETGYWELDKTWFDVVAEENTSIFGLGSGATSFDTSAPHVRIDVILEIDDIGDTQIGDSWCYQRNYPDIKVMDYINEILAHIGGFILGNVRKQEYIEVVTIDEVLSASAVPYDSQGLKSISMSLDGLAQKNNYLHKDNDDDEGLEPYQASGIIYTADETLTLERDAFKSNFKVPRSIFVKLWKVEQNGNKKKASWNNAGNYIGGYVQQGSSATYYFGNTGQDFANIISEAYQLYEQAVHRPKELEVVIRLGVLELLALDLAKPIYIKQFGASFAIVSISTDTGDNYIFTLLKI